jgi:CBS domain-containing protein
MGIQVKDFMSTPVITALGGESVQAARTLMTENGINAIPVISYAKDEAQGEMTIRGIITSTDLNNKVHDTDFVEDVMTSSIHVVHVGSSAQAAAKMMLKHNVHHIVVMDEGKIEGMLSSLDFVKLVAEHSLG